MLHGLQGLAAVAGQHTQAAARAVLINVGNAVAVQVAPRFLGVKSRAAPANQALSVGFEGKNEEGALGAGGISQGAVLPVQTSRPLLALCCAPGARRWRHGLA